MFFGKVPEKCFLEIYVFENVLRFCLNLFLKMYGKKISKPLRKLGHFNLVGTEGESIDQLLQKLETIKEKIVVCQSD